MQNSVIVNLNVQAVGF